ncbi:hypothetical protein [Nocardiopsis ansamitocini]|uniref:Uncharacterized protein n=1 Tax=Nocardiopsis ansamitocini TaxID=1670832 RepID=A0A9W6P5H7_9ACTN|nr:hypothetical protein [Nocardiopsis ansamitocini]GLU47770.1 hypothetical protein Nans01_21210 [Nocardiopsis ansamitocini]
MSSDRPRSVSVVALLADVPSTGHLGNARARRFALDGDDLAGQSAGFLDFARENIAQGKKVVALYPRWRSGRAERAVQFARGALRTDHVAAVPMDLSPLALSLVADQMAYLAPYLPSGLVAALAAELPEHMLAGGWVKSVASLATIPISVRQHMGSLVPGTAFLAFCAPVQRVGRVRRSNPAPNIPFHPVNPVQVLVSAGRDADQSHFDAQFIPAIQPVSSHDLPDQPLGPAYWGTTKYVEFVVFSAHQDALTQPVRAIRPTTCAWCREPVAETHCPFCGAANQPPVGRPPTYSRAVQVPTPTALVPPPAQGSGPPARPAPRAAPPEAPRPAGTPARGTPPPGYGSVSGITSYPQAPESFSPSLGDGTDPGETRPHHPTRR